MKNIEVYRTPTGKYILLEPNDNIEVALRVLDIMGKTRSQPFNFIRMSENSLDVFSNLCKMIDYDVIVVNENGVWRTEYV